MSPIDPDRTQSEFLKGIFDAFILSPSLDRGGNPCFAGRHPDRYWTDVRSFSGGSDGYFFPDLFSNARTYFDSIARTH